MLVQAHCPLSPRGAGPSLWRSPPRAEGWESRGQAQGNARAHSPASPLLPGDCPQCSQECPYLFPAHATFSFCPPPRPHPRLSFYSLWFKAVFIPLVSPVLTSMRGRQQVLSCFPSSKSLCRNILNTEARGAVGACLAVRPGSFQGQGLSLCQAELFARHLGRALHHLRISTSRRGEQPELLWLIFKGRSQAVGDRHFTLPECVSAGPSGGSCLGDGRWLAVGRAPAH